MSLVPPVALYCRTSSEEQAERGTIAAQQEFLRAFATLYTLPVAGEYLDDGVSGTIPLGQRPAGAGLVADAQQRRFGVVLVYRVDRLGRSLTALLEAHAVLSAAGVTLRSATEPFDTSTPIGTFMFQLLGSLAELDKAVIVERMSMGKARRAREGKYVGGGIPLGYRVNAAGRLVPSDVLLPALGCTEAAFVADLYARLAAGSSVMAECRRLNALGLPPPRIFPTKVPRAARQWYPHRLLLILRNPVYRGEHHHRWRHGLIVRPAPVLVAPDLWAAVQQQLVANRHRPHANATRLYVLRGLLRCGSCGTMYTGEVLRQKGTTYTYYRCGTRRSPLHHGPQCHMPRVRADVTECQIWARCQAILAHPGEALALAYAQQGQPQAAASSTAADRDRLRAALQRKADERAYVVTMSQRGLLAFDELEAQLRAVATEAAVLQQSLAALEAHQALQAASVVQYASMEAMFKTLQARVALLGDPPPPDELRTMVLVLIREIRVEARPGQRPPYSLAIQWAW